MSPCLGAYGAAAHPLQMIIANGRCRLQRGGNVVWVHEIALLGAVTPHSGKAIRLQFQIDRKWILLPLILIGQPMHSLLNA